MLCRLIVANPSDPISFKATLLLADFLNTVPDLLLQYFGARLSSKKNISIRLIAFHNSYYKYIPLVTLYIILIYEVD